MLKKDCYHCCHIRPRKNNLCSILRKNIIDIHNFCCKEFQIDIAIQRLEEMMTSEQSDDEGSKRFFWFLFNLKFKPILIY